MNWFNASMKGFSILFLKEEFIARVNPFAITFTAKVKLLIKPGSMVTLRIDPRKQPDGNIIPSLSQKAFLMPG
jgi:hypothetical protein